MPYNSKGHKPEPEDDKNPEPPFIPDFLRIKQFGTMIICSWIEEPTPPHGVLSNKWKSRTVAL